MTKAYSSRSPAFNAARKNAKKLWPRKWRNKKTPAWPKGTKRIVQEGSDGSIKRSFYVERRDGQEVVSQMLSENRTEPVKQIVKVGTKETTSASSSSNSGSSASSSSGNGERRRSLGSAWPAVNRAATPQRIPVTATMASTNSLLPRGGAMGGTGLPPRPRQQNRPNAHKRSRPVPDGASGPRALEH